MKPSFFSGAFATLEKIGWILQVNLQISSQGEDYTGDYIEKKIFSSIMFVKINHVFYTMCDSTPVVVTYSILHTRVIKLDFETGMQIALEKY